MDFRLMEGIHGILRTVVNHPLSDSKVHHLHLRLDLGDLGHPEHPEHPADPADLGVSGDLLRFQGLQLLDLLLSPPPLLPVLSLLRSTSILKHRKRRRRRRLLLPLRHALASSSGFQRSSSIGFARSSAGMSWRLAPVIPSTIS
jgi:hypothetical protein